MTTLSPRLGSILAALSLREGLRVLEVGCGPGALARAMAERGCVVLGLDRSPRAIAQARAMGGGPTYRLGDIETFRLDPDEAPYDLAVAIRVGILDGRHSEGQVAALAALAAALAPKGRLLIDGGDPLREVALPR